MPFDVTSGEHDVQNGEACSPRPTSISTPPSGPCLSPPWRRDWTALASRATTPVLRHAFATQTISRRGYYWSALGECETSVRVARRVNTEEV